MESSFWINNLALKGGVLNSSLEGAETLAILFNPKVIFLCIFSNKR
jgi:hypothetical protein